MARVRGPSYETTILIRDSCLCLHVQRTARTLARRFDNAEVSRLFSRHISHRRESMDYINNKGENIGSLTYSVSNDTSITINRIHDVTIVSTRDRITGKVTTETFIGDSPYGK